MFNIGLGELLFIAILILVVIGPERLPSLMRQLGGYTAQVRGIIRSFNQQFAEELKPIHEIRGLADELNPTKQLGNLLDPDVQRQAPKRPESVKPESNPMSQISQAEKGGAAEPTVAPTPEPGERPANPMAQISQVMSQSTSTQAEASTDTPAPNDTPKEA